MGNRVTGFASSSSGTTHFLASILHALLLTRFLAVFHSEVLVLAVVSTLLFVDVCVITLLVAAAAWLVVLQLGSLGSSLLRTLAHVGAGLLFLGGIGFVFVDVINTAVTLSLGESTFCTTLLGSLTLVSAGLFLLGGISLVFLKS